MAARETTIWRTGRAWLLRLVALWLLNSVHGATLEVALRPTMGREPLQLDALRYPAGEGETFSVTRLSYLLSGFALQREADGAWVELPGQVLWLDAARRRAEGRLTALPEGRYRAFRYFVGLDAATDEAGPAGYPPEHPLNANLNGLHWSWQGGYIYLALEGHLRTGQSAVSGYAFHLARAPQRTAVTLPLTLDLPRDTGVLLDFDLGTLLGGLSFAQDGTATHARPGDALAARLTAQLPGAFQVRQIVTTAPAPVTASPVRPLYLPAHYTPYRFQMNRSFPLPDLPRDNPLLEERVALGRRLFEEKALSRDGTLFCASCHQAAAGFSDPRRVSLGVAGRAGSRQAMPLLDLAWKSNFFWDGRARSLREQVLVPLQEHTEMAETLPRALAKLEKLPGYPALFTAAFGRGAMTAEKLGLALEQFLLTLTSGHSRFDRALQGGPPLEPVEQRGLELFMTEYDPRTGQRGADCFHCHGGALFTDHQFHNNGIEAADPDPGRGRVTNNALDRHLFATPSLRNVACTAPYMHDGRFQTLEEVVAHYSGPLPASETLDPNLAKHPSRGLLLSPNDQTALVAFLRTLTEDLEPEKSTEPQGRLTTNPPNR